MEIIKKIQSDTGELRYDNNKLRSFVASIIGEYSNGKITREELMNLNTLASQMTGNQIALRKPCFRKLCFV